MGSHDIGKSERVIFGGRSGHNLGGHHSCLAFLFLLASRIFSKHDVWQPPAFLYVFLFHMEKSLDFRSVEGI